VVTGTLKMGASELDKADVSMLKHSDKEDETSNSVVLDNADIYKELRLRGYNYSKLFKGLEKVDRSGNSKVKRVGIPMEVY